LYLSIIAVLVDTTIVDIAVSVVVKPTTLLVVDSGSSTGSGEIIGTSGIQKALAPSDNSGLAGSQEPSISDSILNLSCFSLSLLTTVGIDNLVIVSDLPKCSIFITRYICNTELFNPLIDGFILADLLVANIKDRLFSDYCFGILLVANITS
jgi:hypothetical protein